MAEEAEVVRAIYGEDAVRICADSETAAARVEVDLHPRVEEGAALVWATLALRLPPGYPGSAAPQASVERSRGLGDSAVSSLLAAARAAIAVHGLAEDGCVCQILAEVSEALDAANDESECNICLFPCGGRGGGTPVHLVCDHVYHAACLGRWAAIKAAEAEVAAGDSMRSTRAQRDALARDSAEAAARVVETGARVTEVRDEVAVRTARRDAARGRLRLEDPGAEDSDGLEALDEDADNPEFQALDARQQLEVLDERLTSAKAALKQAQADERRAQSRCAELERLLQSLEVELSAHAADVAATGLPCPVCRTPIDRALLQADALQGATHENGSGPGSTGASVASLPPSLREQVVIPPAVGRRSMAGTPPRNTNHHSRCCGCNGSTQSCSHGDRSKRSWHWWLQRQPLRHRHHAMRSLLAVQKVAPRQWHCARLQPSPWQGCLPLRQAAGPAHCQEVAGSPETASRMPSQGLAGRGRGVQPYSLLRLPPRPPPQPVLVAPLLPTRDKHAVAAPARAAARVPGLVVLVPVLPRTLGEQPLRPAPGRLRAARMLSRTMRVWLGLLASLSAVRGCHRLPALALLLMPLPVILQLPGARQLPAAMLG